MVAKLKPLAPYYGGKSLTIGQKIAAMLPAHTKYIEPFGGMAGVLMAKQPAKFELYNDLHGGIVNLFRVVRDQPHELIRRLELTPYAREEWRICNDGWETASDPIEAARMVYVTLAQNFVGRTHGGSWSFGGKGNWQIVETFYNPLPNILAVCKRLKGVAIECQPATTVLDRYNEANTLFYLDPPYIFSSRSQKCKGRKNYSHELTDPEHEALLKQVLESPAMFVISGYASPLYDEMLAGWHRQTIQAQAKSAMQSNGNGRKAAGMSGTERTEVLWFSPNAKPPMLF